ncbi:hypothetical protein AB0F91_46240 [Amycolatopsis sp. NPDC023774]|uniref:hypothetical protein n=1 Tax=Amycolatopsis sp. NPDC023774 TaxID=3155015 RepID=UPI003404B98E
MGAEAADATATRVSPPEDLRADAQIALELVENSDVFADVVAKALPGTVADLEELLSTSPARSTR